jgi:hypothetical protein
VGPTFGFFEDGFPTSTPQPISAIVNSMEDPFFVNIFTR